MCETRSGRFRPHLGDKSAAGHRGAPGIRSTRAKTVEVLPLSNSSNRWRSSAALTEVTTRPRNDRRWRRFRYQDRNGHFEDQYRSTIRSSGPPRGGDHLAATRRRGAPERRPLRAVARRRGDPRTTRAAPAVARAARQRRRERQPPRAGGAAATSRHFWRRSIVPVASRSNRGSSTWFCGLPLRSK